jgi:hypothetical protein
MIIRLTESLHFIFLSCLVNNSRRDGEQQRTHNGKTGRVGSIDQRFRFLTMNVDMASSDWHDFETKKGKSSPRREPKTKKTNDMLKYKYSNVQHIEVQANVAKISSFEHAGGGRRSYPLRLLLSRRIHERKISPRMILLRYWSSSKPQPTETLYSLR